MKYTKFAFFAVWVLSAGTLFGAVPERLQNRVMLNEDANHFYGSRTRDEMTLEGLTSFIDQYADTVVTDLVLNPVGGRANFLNPNREAMWEPNSEGKLPGIEWILNCKALYDRGLNQYEIWINRCREHGIRPWLSFRMNDVHGVEDTTGFGHSSFWVNHPEYWRVPNDTSGIWINRALNFKHAEVRKHVTDFIDILFERYDFDGLELDWMRFGWHLTPDHSEEEGHYLTEVVEYAKKRADEWGEKRGHKIDLSVRVPADPDAARGLGMDVVAWAKSELVDLIVPCPFWASCDFDIPMEVWQERIAGTDVALAPGLEYCVRPYPEGPMTPCTLAELYGFAASEKYRGSTNVYLFNWMDSDTRPVSAEDYRKMLGSSFSPDFLLSAQRVVTLTYRDTVPPGFDNGAQLPKSVDSPAVFHIPAGPKPVKGKNGVLIALSSRDADGQAEFTATLNGVPAEETADAEGAYPTNGRVIFFTFPISAFRDGNNEFAVTAQNGGGEQIIYVSARMNQE